MKIYPTRVSPAIQRFNEILCFVILVDTASTDTHAGINEIGIKTEPSARPSEDDDVSLLRHGQLQTKCCCQARRRGRTRPAYQNATEFSFE
jgi:hypothetical protein